MRRPKQQQYAFLSLAENRDTFFDRVHQFVLPYHDGALLVAKAYMVAKDAFRGVKRKRGERYFEHCRAVAIILMDLLGVRDPEVVAAGLLHDIVEDCPNEWPIGRVREVFGDRVASLVAAVSIPDGAFKDREERMAVYHAQLHAGPAETFHLKLSDRLHNLLSCGALTREAQWRMIVETEKEYLPVALARGLLHKDLKDAIGLRKRALNCRP